MIKKLFKDLRSGENILLESKDVVVALSHGAAWIFTENERYVITGPGGDESGILSLLSKGSANDDYSAIVEMIRPLSKLYPYEKIEGELKADILKRGINKIFNQVRLNDLENSIVIGAILETFTGETLKGELGNTVKMVLTSPGTPYEKIFYNPTKDPSTKNMEVRRVTIREAIEHEKKGIDPLTRGFPEALLFWNEWPAPYKSSQLLFEKADDHNRPETWKDLPFVPSGDQLKILSEELDTRQGIITAYDYIAVFDVLARLQRITGKDRFWVVKGKASNEVMDKAQKKNLVLIETDRIKELTGIDDTDKLKRVKDALANTPRLFWKVRAKDRNDNDVSIKIAVAFTSMIIERDLEGVKGIERVTQLRLNDELFTVGDDRFVLVEPQSFSRLLALPLQTVNPAARLFTHLMAYSNSFNGSRTTLINIEKAAELLGLSSWLETRQPARLITALEDYLDKLKETGSIECWKRQDNGAYKITIGV